MKRLVYIVLLALILPACKDEVNNIVQRATDPERVPTMTSHDASGSSGTRHPLPHHHTRVAHV